VTNRDKRLTRATLTGTVVFKSLLPDGDRHQPSGNGLRQFTKNARTTGWIQALADRTAGPAITVLLSVAAMAQALKVWQWRPGDPVDLSGDSTAGLAQFKNMLDNGWYSSNPDLGAPFDQDPSWFPHADHLHLFLSIKVIGLFSDNPFTVSAIYFFLGFPLAALSMYWLARQRHIGRLGSVVAGVLFSVVPGHQTMFQHLMLASYWVVPLGVWLVLRTALGEPLFRIKVVWRDRVQRSSALSLNFTTAFCVLCIALGGIYYSAFTLLLLAVTLVVRLVATRDRRSAARAALLLITIGAVSLAAVVSVAAGQDKSTFVTTPGERSFWESEVYAGKLMDLILPWIHHRVDALQYLTVAYNSQTTPTLEEPALGVIALSGVVALMVIMLSTLVPLRVKPVHPELGMLGVLTLVAISFYSIGGLGSFVALFVTPQIRTWSRLVIFIALFGLLAVGHWVTVIRRKHRTLGLLAAVALLLIGVLDQTNPALAPQYKDLRIEVADLSAFDHRIEARVTPGCSVFQLPIAPYPDNTPIHDMAGYAHFRPYLASSSLRWSYGAFDGTSLADWQFALPQKSTTALLDDLAGAGFCAVEVDQDGFADRGAKLDSQLTTLLGAPISTTHDNRLLAWDLSPARESLTARVGAEQVKAIGYLTLHPVVVYSDHGAYAIEQDRGKPFQWTGPSPEIDVHNFGRSTIKGVLLTFSLAAPDSAPRRFTVHLPDGRTQEVDVKGGIAQEVQVLVNASPGPNAVNITSNGLGKTTGELLSPDRTDNRIVYGKLINLEAHVAGPMVHIAVMQQRVD
jgi:hypothetical protein